MKSHQQFTHDLNKLSAFYKATTYSYEQTENLLLNFKKNKFHFDEATDFGLSVKQPNYFKIKRSSKIEIRKNLAEIVFVRAVSALEVFLVDLIRDVFLANKEPFKKQDIVIQFTQAELLSIKSPAEVFNKVINKECRKLTSGGFIDIIKYYKKHFNIDLSGFAPGKSKMEEYHDRRHLLVHRLGKTDQQYRDKYNTSKSGISIDDSYLLDCFADFVAFSEMVNNQVIYKLKNDFEEKKKKEIITERKLTIVIELLKDVIPECLEPNFEFWAGDEFSMLSDILDSKKQIEPNKVELKISGTFRQIKSYTRLIRREQRQKVIILETVKEKICGVQAVPLQRILDEEILEQIKNKLPEQPWEKGVHKQIATELGFTNKLVSVAIQQLIARKIFKQQIDGIVIDK